MHGIGVPRGRIAADRPKARRVQCFRVNTQEIVMGHPGDHSSEIPQEEAFADSTGLETVPAPLPGRPRALRRVPIRSLSARHRPRILAHLLALDMNDRYLRFGYAAGDDQIRRYVERIEFERDEIFGVSNRRLELVALAHLAYEPSVDAAAGRPSAAEFGVSVAVGGRCRGYGARLFDHAVLRARGRGVDTIVIHALSENVAMLRIVRNAGAILEHTGADAEARLRLPPEDFAAARAGAVE
jgi:RimJ/RimL family protein N-acetyltransferase